MWITEDEVARLAEHLTLSVEETMDRYCRRMFGKISLNEAKSVSGTYDCVFLKEVRPPRTNRSGEAIVQARRVVRDLRGPAAAVPDVAVLAGEPGTRSRRGRRRPASARA